MEYRIEKDSMGEVKVPVGAYFGAQTMRSVENFKIGQGVDNMPREMILAIALVKKAAAIANMDLGTLSKEKADLVCEAAQEIIEGKLDAEFPLVVWQTGSGTQTNMNVNEVIANRAHVISGGKLIDDKKIIHPNDDVNCSQSSNDVFPTAMHISGYKTLSEITIPGIKKLRDVLANKALEFKDVVKLGRTHMMDATPITFGQEFGGYVAQLDHSLNSLNFSLNHMLEIALGGTAVGTGINTPSGYDKKVAEKIAELTGFSFVTAPNKFEALSANDALIEVHSVLKNSAVILMKIGNDIRFYSSGPYGGIGEINLPENEPGSSIMPGKINPTQCEMLTMIGAQVMGNDVAITIGGASGHFQLNTFRPMLINNFLQSARLIGEGCISFAENCISGIKLNEEKISENLNHSLMLVTALVPRVGYEKAAEIAQKAHKEHKTLKQSALELGYVSEVEFDEIVNPNNMV